MISPKNWPVGSSLTIKEIDSRAEMCSFREAGFKYVEFKIGYDDTTFDNDILGKKAQIIKDLGFTLWSVHIPFNAELDISQLNEEARSVAVMSCKRFLGLAAAWGAKKTVIHASSEPVEEKGRALRLQHCKRSLVFLAFTANSLGIQLAVEVLPRTCLGNTSEEIMMFLEGNEHLGVCYDTNHLLYENASEFINKIGSKIVTMHASDYDGIDEKHWLPGLGSNNWSEIIGHLVKVGYQGPFMFEVYRFQNERVITPLEMMEAWKRIIGPFRYCS